MIYRNNGSVFAVNSDEKISVFCAQTRDMVTFSKSPEPKNIMEKIKAKLEVSPKYQTIVQPQYDKVLQDEDANVVEMTHPGTVDVAFINEDGSLSNGATVNLLTMTKDLKDSGFWINGLSQKMLNEHAQDHGVTTFEHAQTQQNDAVADVNCDMNQ